MDMLEVIIQVHIMYYLKKQIKCFIIIRKKLKKYIKFQIEVTKNGFYRSLYLNLEKEYKQKYQPTIYELARFYEDGIVVEKDLAKSKELIKYADELVID